MPAQRMRPKPQVNYYRNYYPDLPASDDESSEDDSPAPAGSSDVEILDREAEDTEASDLGSDSEYSHDSSDSANESDEDNEMLDVGDTTLDRENNNGSIEYFIETTPTLIAVDYEHRCVVCDVPNARACPDCQAVSYCSIEHQAEDWRLHGHFCCEHKALSEPKPNMIRAVILPIGDKDPAKREKRKWMFARYTTERVPRRRDGYMRLTIDDKSITQAIQQQGSTVKELMCWNEHPESSRLLPRAMKVFRCSDYKGSGKTRYLLVMVQRELTAKALRDSYGEDGVAKHWDPRTYDVGPADISMAVAWLNERFQK